MEFLLIASAHFCALLSPGPDFFLIMQAALRLPVCYCISLCLGIAMANGVYLLLAVLGLEFIKNYKPLSLGLQYLGGVYLLFIGIMLLRAPKADLQEKAVTRGIHSRHHGKQWLLGFLSGVLNPKNGIFYLAIFAVMVGEDTPLLQRGLYGCWMTAVVFFWDSFIVLTLSRPSVQGWFGGGLYYIEKFSGVLLAFFGVFLAFS